MIIRPSLVKKPSWSELQRLNGSWRQHPSYRGVIGHWIMTEGGGKTVRDISGFGRDGTLTNVGAAPAWVNGNFGKTVHFPGGDSDAYLRIDDGNAFEFATQDFSFSTWVVHESAGNEMIISKSDSNDDFWRLITLAEIPWFSLNTVDVKATDSIVANELTQVGFVAKRNGNGQVYLNGEPNGAPVDISSVTLSLAATFTSIGAWNGTGTSQEWTGIIDNAILWKRAISDAEMFDQFYDPFKAFRPRRRVWQVLVKIIAITQATETDLAQSLTRAKARGVSQAAEADTAQLLSALKTSLAGQAVEADLAQAVSSHKAKFAAQITETNLAQTLSKLKSKGIVQTTETDLAQSLIIPSIRLITQATEIDLAQAVSRLKTKTLAQITETDLAQLVTVFVGVIVGQVAETSLAQALTRIKTTSIFQATETDLAQVLAKNKVKSILQALESDLAQATSKLKAKSTVQATETDLAQALSRLKSELITQATETDLAQILSKSKAKAIGQVTESDIAQVIINAAVLIVLLTAKVSVRPAIGGSVEARPRFSATINTRPRIEGKIRKD